jgi:hypothetical protein
MFEQIFMNTLQKTERLSLARMFIASLSALIGWLIDHVHAGVDQVSGIRGTDPAPLVRDPAGFLPYVGYVFRLENRTAKRRYGTRCCLRLPTLSAILSMA